MIKTRRVLGIVIVTGIASTDEIIVKPQGSKLVVLPPWHHIHRNPRRPIIAWIERMEYKEANRG